ncbi:class C sortase [Alloiococcus sp. CFN-8]|uniref:class C sortase n=1 Tax=Alloiococcus sp. CFN-8 TaxID=3416081 RepID=UPI003CF68B45
MIRRIFFIIGIFFFLAGLALFLYPQINGWLIEKDNEKAISSFKKERESQMKNDADIERENPELYEAIKEYNLELFETGQTDLKDAWSYEQDPINLESFSLKEGVIGYIEIPKITVELPLYLGASEENMSKGATILGETSIPIGGENSNSVIACHRGFRGAAYFKEIEKLEAGDIVYVTNPWEKLIYEIKEVEVINPNEISKVLIREGKDMITLVTCHPYRVSTHRYVVYCERVE